MEEDLTEEEPDQLEDEEEEQEQVESDDPGSEGEDERQEGIGEPPPSTPAALATYLASLTRTLDAQSKSLQAIQNCVAKLAAKQSEPPEEKKTEDMMKRRRVKDATVSYIRPIYNLHARDDRDKDFVLDQAFNSKENIKRRKSMMQKWNPTL